MLNELRKKIDASDKKIVKLLNERIKLVKKVGKYKHKNNLNIYDPAREAAVINKVLKYNTEFPPEALKNIYHEITSASISVEQPVRAAYLGPEATFTHQAALKKFGTAAEYFAQKTIKKVFEEVETGRCDYGVVPVENSTEGVVNYTLDLLAEANLNIVSEMYMSITHNLIGKQYDLKKINEVYSHPQALAQCRAWLEEKMANVKIIETDSTAAAAKLIKNNKSAAVGSDILARIYGLKVIKQNISDKHNVTRFLIIGNEAVMLKGAGSLKTSIAFSVQDKPGALAKMLKPFEDNKINLTKIESRPGKINLWNYVFFVDFEGSASNPKVKKALLELKKQTTFFKILGCYPKI